MGMQMPLCMHASNAEVNLFLKHTLECKNYLEFGAGGSTLTMLYATLANIISVESDLNFLHSLAKIPQISHALQTKRLQFLHIDIGQTGAWGVPKNLEKEENFPLYSGYVFQSLNNWPIDVVFIDGRFRVACVLNALLNCAESPKIIIDDFFDREFYQCVLEFLEVIDRVDSMGVFVPKKELDKEKITRLLQEYCKDYR